MMPFDFVKDQIFRNIIHHEVSLKNLCQCFLRLCLSLFTRLKIMHSILLSGSLHDLLCMCLNQFNLFFVIFSSNDVTNIFSYSHFLFCLTQLSLPQHFSLALSLKPKIHYHRAWLGDMITE